jgi:hypothetical protein
MPASTWITSSVAGHLSDYLPKLGETAVVGVGLGVIADNLINIGRVLATRPSP